jgi:hypothetical protein
MNDHEGTAPKWWEWLITGVVIAVGVVLCATGVGTALGVSLLVAGGSMLASNIMSAAGVNGKVASIISSVLNIVAGVALCFTPFAAIGASMIGGGIGGIAGGYISEALGGSFETGAMIGGIVGSIIGGQIHKGLTTTKLYRAVGSVEAKSLASSGKFSAVPGQMEGKFFATSKANATTWGKGLSGTEKIIATRVLKSGLSHESVTFFAKLDFIGPAYYFSNMAHLNSIISKTPYLLYALAANLHRF